MPNLRAVTKKAIKAAGGGAALSRAIGGKPSRHAIYQWSHIPADRVHAVEQITGIPRHELRPDLYPAEREKVDA